MMQQEAGSNSRRNYHFFSIPTNFWSARAFTIGIYLMDYSILKHHEKLLAFNNGVKRIRQQKYIQILSFSLIGSTTISTLCQEW